MNKKKVKALLKGWKESEVTACAATGYLATAQKLETGILLVLYKRYQHFSHDPYAVIECMPDDFSVWYPDTDKTSKATVLSLGSDYAKIIRNIYTYCQSDPYADVTFVTAEDKAVAEEFFQAYQETYYGYASKERIRSLPSPWNSFIWYQIGVLDKRLKKRHFNRDQKRERLFSYLKEPTDGFKNWVWNKVMEDTQFIFYKPVTGTKVQIQCSVCKADEIRKKSELVNFGRKNEGKCPVCGAKVTYLPANVQPSWICHTKRVGIMQKTPEGFVYRLFSANRVYTTKQMPSPSDAMEEISRWFISDDSNTGYLYEYGKWAERDDGWFYSDFLYPKTVKGAIADTKYRICGIDQLAKPCVEMRHQIFLFRWPKYPVLEKIVKSGFLAAIQEYMRDDFTTRKIIDTSKDDLYGALKLPRSEVRRIVRLKYRNCIPVIMTMQEAVRRKISLRDEEIMEVTNLNIETNNRVNTLFKIMKMTGLTAHKATKYLTHQAEMFPATQYRTSIEEALSAYEDYLEMAEYLRCDLHDRGVSMRSNLKKAHDEILIEYNTQRDRIMREEKERKHREYKTAMTLIRGQVEANHSDAMHLRSDDLMILGLWTPEALIEEGKALHNCITGYPARVANGLTMVFAVRKTKEPDKPFCAFEYRDDRIIQVRADHNAEAPEDVKAFVDIFHEMYQKEKKQKSAVAA